MKLVFLGPPGAGKGTQAARVAEQLDILHASTGDIFRAAVKDETDLGKQVKGILDSGGLVPDELTCRVVEEGVLDKADSYILDGFPRTIAQAEMLDKTLRDRGQKTDGVVFFALDDGEALRRLTGRRMCRECGKIYHVDRMPPRREGVCDACDGELYVRSDSALEAVRKRLQEYHEKTEPLVGYYQAKGLLRRIEASQAPEAILGQCLGLLGELK